MPFEKGQSGNPEGRKGYGYEKQQLEKMMELINKYLIVCEQILSGEYTHRDVEIIKILSPDLRKMMDKLHASKSEQDTTLELGDNLASILLHAHRRSLLELQEGDTKQPNTDS